MSRAAQPFLHHCYPTPPIEHLHSVCVRFRSVISSNASLTVRVLHTPFLLQGAASASKTLPAGCGADEVVQAKFPAEALASDRAESVGMLWLPDIARGGLWCHKEGARQSLCVLPDLQLTVLMIVSLAITPSPSLRCEADSFCNPSLKSLSH